MKKILFAFVSAFAAPALTVLAASSGCDQGGGSTGGNGGAGQASGGGAGGENGGGGTGGSGADVCSPAVGSYQVCGPEFTNTLKPCWGPLADLYDAVEDCACSGACAPDCGASACAGTGATADAACFECLSDPIVGCGEEFTACTTDQ